MATKVLLKFADDDNYYKCEIQRMSEHMVKVSGLLQNTSGFGIYSDSKILIGDYSEYIYEYANPNLAENVFEYTDNNAEYPNEGNDKSLKEQIKEELQVYTKSEVDNTISEISNDISNVEETSDNQLSEIQLSLIDIFETISNLTKEISNLKATIEDLTTKPTETEV